MLTIISCKEKKTETGKIIKSSENLKKSENKSGIYEFVTLEFRRSYVGHENLSDYELKKMQNANPTLLTLDTAKVVKELNQIGLMSNQDLVLRKFKDEKINKAFLDDKNKVEATFEYYPKDEMALNITVNNGMKTNFKKIDLSPPYLFGLILSDIDNDNTKEILIVTVDYVMNGDNFDLKILKNY